MSITMMSALGIALAVVAFFRAMDSYLDYKRDLVYQNIANL